MDRAELERLDREGLVLRAQAAGIRRARVLTRPELIDELLRLDPATDQTLLKKNRGFFGIARDLLSKVVEKGLHLPDAAERFRAALNPLPHVPRPEPQAVPTVTLAEIYAAQGHKGRAIETLQRVLESEPDHGAARVLLEKLEATGYVPPPPPVLPEVDEAGDEIGSRLGQPVEDEALADFAQAARESEHLVLDEVGEREEPAASIASEAGASEDVVSEDVVSEALVSEPVISTLPLPSASDSDSDSDYEHEHEGGARCVALPLGGGRTFVWWEVGAAARSPFVVRAVVIVPGWDGPKQETRDIACDPTSGGLVLADLPDGAVVRVAVGRMEEDDLVPLAHSPALEIVAERGLCEWTLDGMAEVTLDEPHGAIAQAFESARRAGLAVRRSAVPGA
jgi:hypothetical protein